MSGVGNRRSIVLFSAAMSAAIVLASCGSSGSVSSASGSATPVSGGNLVDLQNFAAGDPTHIDPALADDVQSSQIANLLYDGLTKTDASGKLHNAVAESADANADATVWTFKVRKDVKFDNGDTVKPSDFSVAWDRAVDPVLGSKMSSQFALIKGYKDVDGKAVTHISGVIADDAASTLTVTLSSPYRDFPAVVSLPVFSPLPQKLNATDQWEQGVMVGDGPFKMASAWKAGQSIKLVRNDSYYGGYDKHKAYLDSVEFRISKDVDSAYKSFDSGDGQVARIPAGSYADVKATKAQQLVNTPLMATEFWGFNMKDPSVGGADNAELRGAIALAINKADIVDKVYNGSRVVANSFAPPSTPGYAAGTARSAYDLKAAKQLLTDWGKTPPAIKVSFNAGAGHDDKAAIIVQNLQAIGIKATADPLANPDYKKALGTGTLQFFRFSWVADYVSYDDMLSPSFSTENIGQSNLVNYSNATFDASITKARAESDDAARAADYRAAETQVLSDNVVVPLDWSTAGVVTTPSVQALKVGPLGYADYTNAWLKS